jgi:hypothetical protein
MNVSYDCDGVFNLYQIAFFFENITWVFDDFEYILFQKFSLSF